jgi:2'-5' RNA ligase
MADILTYWLMPAEPARAVFASLIRDLAARFDAPVFDPHLTLHTVPAGKDDPAVVLQSVRALRKSYRLKIAGVGHSQEYTKTLFVQFDPDESVNELSANLCAASASREPYALNPHLSLIYKEMPALDKAKLAASLALPFPEVTFDSIRAVVSPAEIKTREDVEKWRVVGEMAFG